MLLYQTKSIQTYVSSSPVAASQSASMVPMRCRSGPCSREFHI